MEISMLELLKISSSRYEGCLNIKTEDRTKYVDHEQCIALFDYLDKKLGIEGLQKKFNQNTIYIGDIPF